MAAVALGYTGERGGSAVDLRGGRKNRGENGGEWEERPRGRGVGVLIHLDAGERVRWRTRPVAARDRGTGRGAERGAGPAEPAMLVEVQGRQGGGRCLSHLFYFF